MAERHGTLCDGMEHAGLDQGSTELWWRAIVDNLCTEIDGDCETHCGGEGVACDPLRTTADFNLYYRFGLASQVFELYEGVPMTDVRTGEITRTILIDRRAVEATFWEEAGGRFRVSSAGLPTLLVERNIDAPIEDHWAYSCSASGAAHVGDWEFGKTPSAAFAAGVRGFWRPVRL